MSSASARTVCEERARRPVSIAELFTIGIGPSSSHTVGPMRAAAQFVGALGNDRKLARLRVKLHGSLALTGRGHHTDRAVIVGLGGHLPAEVNAEMIEDFLASLERTGRLPTPAGEVAFDANRDIAWCKRFVRDHPNAMDFIAEFEDGTWEDRRFFSVGGGAIVEADRKSEPSNVDVAHSFSSASELLEICERTGLTIAELVLENELAWRSTKETKRFVQQVRAEMLDCIERGIAARGVLPGGLGVKRRAGGMHQDLLQRERRDDPSTLFEWVSLWALAVNEENAAGGRVVTAPTNGAAGVIPAVLKYLETYVEGGPSERSEEFILTTAAIGFLYKKRASISAAEMGCQGEVGVACSMAAAGLAAAMGATPRQVENAAEIGMEHNLGLTCDPIGGLVQIPCIERNTMGAIKAINAALLALRGDGTHLVSLDQVIETMRQTGIDMRSKYKETSTGGLAVNVVEC